MELNRMPSADINEIYEKLLQLYETRYTNPKAVLYYQINELVREGRTREEAILTLYEQEGKLTSEEAKKLEEASKEEKRKFTIELLNGSKVYANKWNVEFQASIAAIVPKMMVKAEHVVYEKKEGEKTQHDEIFIPIFSITAIYKTQRKQNARKKKTNNQRTS